MNTRFKSGFTLLQALLCIAVIGLIAALSPSAHAQTDPRSVKTFTNGTPLLAGVSGGAVTSNLTWSASTVVPIYSDRDYSLFVRAVGASNSENAGTISLQFDLSYANTYETNFTTSKPLKFTFAHTGGTSPIILHTNITRAQLGNAAGIRWSSTVTTGQTNTLLLSPPVLVTRN